VTEGEKLVGVRRDEGKWLMEGSGCSVCGRRLAGEPSYHQLWRAAELVTYDEVATPVQRNCLLGDDWLGVY